MMPTGPAHDAARGRLVTAIAVLWLGVVSQPARAGDPAAEISGPWLTDGGDSIVRFESCGTGWCGRIARILRPNPGGPGADVHNPDPGLRHRPMEGLQLFSLDRFDDKAWRGTVYDPRSGRTWQAMVRRSGPAVLEIKGCFAVFCQTRHWSSAR